MTPQPAPRPGTGDMWKDLLHDPVVRQFPNVVALGWQRRSVGIARYGVPLQLDNGRDMRQDAQEEALDLAVYLWALGWRWSARAALLLAWAL